MPKGHPRIAKELRVYNGGRPPTFTDEDIPHILEKIEEGEGHKGRTASLLGISTSTLNKYLNKYPVLQEAIDDANLGRAEEVLDVMMERIREGANGSHIREIFLLKTLGGFKETQHIVREDHRFDWSARLKEAEKHHEEIVDGEFVEDENEYGGW